MQMIPGLERSPNKGSSQDQDRDDKVRKMREEAAAAKAVIDKMKEAHDKLKFEHDFMIDWYERKTNQRLQPEQIVRNVLGGQAYREYVETVKSLAEIQDKLIELVQKP